MTPDIAGRNEKHSGKQAYEYRVCSAPMSRLLSKAVVCRALISVRFRLGLFDTCPRMIKVAIGVIGGD